MKIQYKHSSFLKINDILSPKQCDYENLYIVQYINMILLKKDTCSYKICLECIQPCNMENKDIYWRRHKIQETLYIGQWHLRPHQTKHLGPHTVLPVSISCPLVFFWISLMVCHLFPFKGDFSFGKSQKLQSAQSGL